MTKNGKDRTYISSYQPFMDKISLTIKQQYYRINKEDLCQRAKNITGMILLFKLILGKCDFEELLLPRLSCRFLKSVKVKAVLKNKCLL